MFAELKIMLNFVSDSRMNLTDMAVSMNRKILEYEAYYLGR